MHNKILLATETVTLASQFVLCMFAFLTAQILLFGSPSAWYEQCVFLAYFILAIAIRIFITNSFFIFIGLHLFLASSLLVLPFSLLMTIEAVIYLSFLLIQSVDFWRRNGYRQDTSVPWPSICTMLGFYIYGILTKNDVLCSMIYPVGIVYLLLYLAKLYLTGLHKLANDNTTGQNFPLRQVTRINSILILLILIITAISILLANLINLDHTLLDIGSGLLVLLKYIIAGISYLWGLIGHFFHAGENADFLPDTGALEALRQEPTLLATIFDILFKLFECAMFAWILYRIFKSFYRLSKKIMLKNLLPQDHVEGIQPDIEENNRDLQQPLDMQARAVPVSKIRRRYKRAILRHRKEIVLHQAMTTGEIYTALPKHAQEQLLTLQQQYNNERYANQEKES